MRRTTMRIAGHSYALARGQEAAPIEDAALLAARDGAGIVTVTLYGNRELHILVTPGVPITFETRDVEDDERDDGDLTSPFEADTPAVDRGPDDADWDLGY